MHGFLFSFAFIDSLEPEQFVYLYSPEKHLDFKNMHEKAQPVEFLFFENCGGP
jgi:hypothetical protein